MKIKPIRTILLNILKFIIRISRAWLALPFVLMASILFIIAEVITGQKLCFRARDVIRSVTATCTECGHTSKIDKIIDKDSKGKYKGGKLVHDTVTAL